MYSINLLLERLLKAVKVFNSESQIVKYSFVYNLTTFLNLPVYSGIFGILTIILLLCNVTTSVVANSDIFGSFFVSSNNKKTDIFQDDIGQIYCYDLNRAKNIKSALLMAP